MNSNFLQLTRLLADLQSSRLQWSDQSSGRQNTAARRRPVPRRPGPRHPKTKLGPIPQAPCAQNDLRCRRMLNPRRIHAHDFSGARARGAGRVLFSHRDIKLLQHLSRKPADWRARKDSTSRPPGSKPGARLMSHCAVHCLWDSCPATELSSRRHRTPIASPGLRQLTQFSSDSRR